MHNVDKVFMFELKSILRKKSVLVTTIIIASLFFIATFIPMIIGFFDKEEPTSEGPQNPSMYLIGEAAIVLNTSELSVEELELFIEQVDVFTTQSELENQIRNNRYSIGYIIDSPTFFTYVVNNQELYSYSSSMFQSVLSQIQVNKNLIEQNLDPNQVHQAFNVQIRSESIILGKDASSGFLMTYILMFAVYMLVIMYGSFVSTSVAREKDNRTMELLITSTKPSTLIVGKVFANGVAGIVQFGSVILAGLLGLFINQNSFPEELLQMLKGGMAWDSWAIFLIFTISGYLLYLFIYASLGSLVSKVEDVGASVTPITMLFIVAYLIASIGMQMPNGLALRIGSYVPFTAILAMPIRYTLSTVGWYELVISMILMILATLIFAYLSIRIYRLGSLNYGNKIGFIKAIKMVIKKENA